MIQAGPPTVIGQSDGHSDTSMHSVCRDAEEELCVDCQENVEQGNGIKDDFLMQTMSYLDNEAKDIGLNLSTHILSCVRYRNESQHRWPFGLRESFRINTE